MRQRRIRNGVRVAYTVNDASPISTLLSLHTLVIADLHMVRVTMGDQILADRELPPSTNVQKRQSLNDKGHAAWDREAGRAGVRLTHVALGQVL